MIKNIICLVIMTAGLVYSRTGMSFSHNKHVVENEAECAACHKPVMESNGPRTADRARLEKTCNECHDNLKIPKAGFRLTDRSFKRERIYPAGFIIYTHKKHLGRDMTCENCHGKPVIEDKTPPTAPKMSA